MDTPLWAHALKVGVRQTGATSEIYPYAAVLRIAMMRNVVLL
jgi:hypothetical protein